MLLLPEVDFGNGYPWSELGRFEVGHPIEERMRHHGVPGLAVAVIDSFEVEWTGGWGVLEAGGNEPVTDETLFEAASTTKVATAAVVLRLIEMGLLQLDQDVNEILLDWRVPDTPPSTSERVTVLRLLSHTAGINRPDGGFDIVQGEAPTLTDVLMGRAPAINKALAVEHVPGSKHQYSNLGFILLQQIIEDATGRLYSDVAQQEVFKPLDMGHSTFEPNLPGWSGPRTPSHHDSDGRPVSSDVHPTALAHGQLWTTPADLAKLTASIMSSAAGREDGLLDAETAQLALTTVREIDPAPHAGLLGQGLGVFILDTPDGPGFCHPGFNSPGTACFLIGFPSAGKGAVVMANGANGLDLSFEVLSGLAREYSWPSPEGGPPN
jgi:CubicO group peptidase (beta-lactamase class C family)